MGMYFVNFPLVTDGQLDVTRPEIVIYEPLPNGRLRLIGADYLVLADALNATHSGPPQLMGQHFHFFESTNRFGLPALSLPCGFSADGLPVGLQVVGKEMT